MTDYRVVIKQERISGKHAAYARINQVREEFDSFWSATHGVGYSDWLVKVDEEPQHDGRALYTITYKVLEKIPVMLSISRKVDGDALKTLPKPQRDILTSKVVSDDWDQRNWKWSLPEFLRKGRLKGGNQTVPEE